MSGYLSVCVCVLRGVFHNEERRRRERNEEKEEKHSVNQTPPPNLASCMHTPLERKEREIFTTQFERDQRTREEREREKKAPGEKRREEKTTGEQKEES